MPKISNTKLTLSRFFLESSNSTKTTSIINDVYHFNGKYANQQQKDNRKPRIDQFKGFTPQEMESARKLVKKIEQELKFLQMCNFLHKDNNCSKVIDLRGFSNKDQADCFLKTLPVIDMCNTFQNYNADNVNTFEKRLTGSKHFSSISKYQYKGFTNEEKVFACKLHQKVNKHVTLIQSGNYQGFSSGEIQYPKPNNPNENIRINKQCFSQKDEVDCKTSRVCEELKTQICDEEESRKKVVSSKYWLCQQKVQVKLERYNFDKKLSHNHQPKLEISPKKWSTKKENDFIGIKNEIEEKHYGCTIRRMYNLKFEDVSISHIKNKVVPPFIPPISPHNLIEEQLYHDPWSLLVATIFLNKTSCRNARPYVFLFLHENPSPFDVLKKTIDDLVIYFAVLGLQKRRATQVWRMSHDYIYKDWKKVGELYGVGRYGEDAFRMFCLGDFSMEPKDRYLRIYKAWYEMNEKKQRIKEMNS